VASFSAEEGGRYSGEGKDAEEKRKIQIGKEKIGGKQVGEESNLFVILRKGGREQRGHSSSKEEETLRKGEGKKGTEKECLVQEWPEKEKSDLSKRVLKRR